MNEVERFVKKHERSEQEKAANNTAVELQKKVVGRLDGEMRLAATAGDVDLFRQTKAAKTAEEEKLLVMEASFRAPVPDLDEAKAVWDSYSKKYSVEFKKRYEALQAARRAVKSALSDLASCQNEALKNREKLAEICGPYHASLADYAHPWDVFPVEQIKEEYTSHPRFAMNLPEVSYLVELGLYGPDNGMFNSFKEVDRLNSIFRLEQSAE